MLPPVPRCSGWASSSLISPSGISLPRNCSRVGLHIDLFEACSAFTRVAARTLARSPICDQLHRRLQPFRHLHDCSGSFRLERSGRVGLAPTGKRRLVTAHTLSGRCRSRSQTVRVGRPCGRCVEGEDECVRSLPLRRKGSDHVPRSGVAEGTDDDDFRRRRIGQMAILANPTTASSLRGRWFPGACNRCTAREPAFFEFTRPDTGSRDDVAAVVGPEAL